MKLSENDRMSAIADLPSNHGFLALLDNLTDDLNVITAEMATAQSDEAVLRNARLFQVFFKFLTTLRDRPQEMRAALEAEFEHARALGNMRPSLDPFMTPERLLKLRQLESMQLHPFNEQE